MVSIDFPKNLITLGCTIIYLYCSWSVCVCVCVSMIIMFKTTTQELLWWCIYFLKKMPQQSDKRADSNKVKKNKTKHSSLTSNPFAACQQTITHHLKCKGSRNWTSTKRSYTFTKTVHGTVIRSWATIKSTRIMRENWVKREQRSLLQTWDLFYNPLKQTKQIIQAKRV